MSKEKKGKRYLPLQMRIILLVAGILLVLAVAVSYSVSSKIENELGMEFESKGRAIAKSLASSSVESLVSGSTSDIQGFIDNFRDISGVLYIFILDESGQVVAHTFSPTFPDGFEKINPVPEDKEFAVETVEVSLEEKEEKAIDISVPILAGVMGFAHVGMNKSIIDGEVASGRNLIITLFTVMLILGIGLIYWFLSVLIRPMRGLLVLSEKVGEGDLSAQMPITSRDEFATIGEAFNNMVANLKVLVERIRTVSINITSTANQIITANQRISKGAKDQSVASEDSESAILEMATSIQSVTKNADILASKVQETTSSINELGASADSVAKNAENMSNKVDETSSTTEQMVATFGTIAKNVLQADNLSKTADQEAKTGGDAIIKMTESMTEMTDSLAKVNVAIKNLEVRSDAIKRITGVMEDVADQTNLLALNASIEAARAGKAGWGFNVVAQEIRKLAEHSMKSASEINKLVNEVRKDTVEAVRAAEEGEKTREEGAALTDQARKAIERILESVASTSKLMEQVANATSEQSKAAQTTLESVGDLNSLTHSVSGSTVEQAKNSSMATEVARDMALKTDEVKNAMLEQKQTGHRVVQSIENFSRIAKENTEAADQLSNAAAFLGDQSGELEELVKRFKIS